MPRERQQVRAIQINEAFQRLAALQAAEDVAEQGPQVVGIDGVEDGAHLRVARNAVETIDGVEVVVGVLAARVVDNQDRVASSLLERESAGFTAWDLRSFWQIQENLLLIAGVENFTDKHYREHLDLRTGTGLFQPGVNFYFGFELTY